MDLPVFIYIIVLLLVLFEFIMHIPRKEKKQIPKKAVTKEYVFQNNYNKNPDLTRKQRRLLRIKRRLQ